MVSPTAVQKLGADFNRAPIGTGPFKVNGGWSGGKLTADKWDGYWQKDENGEQLPYLDHVEMVEVPNAVVQLAQLQSGAAQWGDTTQPQDYPTIKANPGLELVKQPYQTTMYSSFNNSGAPFQDNLNLRKAVSLAINRKALADIIVGEYGGPAVGVEPPASWANGEGVLKGHVYDPDGAKAAYAASGHSGPIVLSIIQRDPDSQVAQIIQSMLSAVGIDLQIEVLERAAWIEKVSSGHFQMTVQGASTPYPDNTFTQYYARTAAQNYSMMHDETIFSLVDQTLREMDQDKRRDLYIKAQQQLLDQYYQTFLYWTQRYAVRSTKVHGMVIERVNSFVLTSAWLDA
jgi:peptide/nickel transport system substrate-binding protein